jgi:predicted dehydrogenase
MERRDFLKGGAAIAAASSGPFLGNVLGANDRIGVGVIGQGTRGDFERRICATLPDSRVIAIAEVYRPLLDRGLSLLPYHADGYEDFRKMLDRKDIDAIFVSTPDHWHAPATIMACQAGKDVHCEKPMSHTIHEGRAMVDAARKYKRIVQVGSQQRSAPHFQKVVEMIRSGYIGKISAVECWNTGNEAPVGIGKLPDSDPPDGLNWDLYLGPAPKVPYNRNRHTWNYRWFWDYSGGMVTDWGAHHIDVIHWAMGVNAPLSASAWGGRFCCEDNCETPDTVSTAYQYPGFTVEYRVRSANARNVEGRSNGIAFFGTNGTLVVDRTGWEVVPEFEPLYTADVDRVQALLKNGSVALPVGFDRSKAREKRPRSKPDGVSGININPSAQEDHVRNFFECMRTRKLPVADVEIGHRSVTACHIGVIAYRLGRSVRWDAQRETFPGDAEAQKMMTKPYRAPYALPKV